jgi:hypothetical protein
MWWDDKPERFNQEVRMLRQNFPGVKIVMTPAARRYCTSCGILFNEKGKHLAVFAEVFTRLGCAYPIVMVYPCSFPRRVPAVWLLNELKPAPPAHQYVGGRLCLTANESQPNLQGSTVLGWAFGWLNCYDIWRKTGVFPASNHGRHKV